MGRILEPLLRYVVSTPAQRPGRARHGTAMGQLPSIFQVHVDFFTPGLRKYKKQMEWNQIFKAPSMFARSTSGGFRPTHLEPSLS